MRGEWLWERMVWEGDVLEERNEFGEGDGLGE